MTKEIPILFSTPMVQAILDGRKTMTRRIVKPQINDCMPMHELYAADWKAQPFTPSERALKNGRLYCELCGNGTQLNKDFGGLKCPYGKPGDRLWVRETFKEWGTNPETYAFKADGFTQRYGAWEIDTPNKLHDVERIERWSPGIHMPKSACRIWLEVVSVRVERLQEITEQDAIAEGIEQIGKGPVVWRNYLSAGAKGLHSRNGIRFTARDSFKSLWQSINGPDSWNANPWVWVVEFKRIEK